MIEFSMTINNLLPENEPEFIESSTLFLEELQNITLLNVELQKKQEKNTRGFVTILSGILLKAIELGIFAGVYTAIIDFYDRYKNAEVTLKFKNGNTITIKGLTQKEALELIKQNSK